MEKIYKILQKRPKNEYYRNKKIILNKYENLQNKHKILFLNEDINLLKTFHEMGSYLYTYTYIHKVTYVHLCIHTYF